MCSYRESQPVAHESEGETRPLYSSTNSYIRKGDTTNEEFRSRSIQETSINSEWGATSFQNSVSARGSTVSQGSGKTASGQRSEFTGESGWLGCGENVIAIPRSDEFASRNIKIAVEGTGDNRQSSGGDENVFYQGGKSEERKKAPLTSATLNENNNIFLNEDGVLPPPNKDNNTLLKTMSPKVTDNNTETTCSCSGGCCSIVLNNGGTSPYQVHTPPYEHTPYEQHTKESGEHIYSIIAVIVSIVIVLSIFIKRLNFLLKTIDWIINRFLKKIAYSCYMSYNKIRSFC